MKSNIERKSTTILAADIVGYSRLISDNEDATLDHFRSILGQFVRPTIVRNNGRLVKFIGDAILAEFSDPGDAVSCAIQVQSDLTIHNATVPEGRKMYFRMGIHWGDVTVEGEDLLGDTVNIASRLEGLAETGGIVISESVRTAMQPSEGVGFKERGAESLKNIPDPVLCFDVDFDPAVFASRNNETVLQPYRGLAAFREVDRELFFGRESFVELLVNAVAQRSLVAVIGSSGSGKSSVVAAGLLPTMREQGWLIAQFRPGSRPFVEISNALQPLLLPDVSLTAQRSAAQSLADTMSRGEVRLLDLSTKLRKQYPEAAGILIVADQFEEFLTLCTDQLQRELFQDLIVGGQLSIDEAVAEGQEVLPLVFVTTLRADFMGKFLEYRPLADAMQNGDIKLGPMTRDELQRTIQNPAKLQGVGFAPGLIERILDDVGQEPGNLPLLQFALTALWEKNAELGAELSHQAYEEIGRVQGALAYHADDVFNSLQPPEQILAQEVFVQLVQPGEGVASTRRVATRAELGEEGWQLIQRLADSRLVITGRNTAGEETAEVVHEALIRDWDRLRDWLVQDFSFRTWQERLRGAISQWQSSNLDRGGLLRGVALSEAIGWQQSHGQRLSDIELDYINQGQQLLDEQRQNEQEQVQRQAELTSTKKSARKLKTLTLALASVLAIAIGAALFASAQQRSAVDARKVAESERLVAQEAQEKTDDALKIAESARVEAEAARSSVEAAKEEVEILNRQILAQQLAAESVLANDNAADRSAGLPLLLGMEAVKATLDEDNYSLLVANNALRQAVRTAPVQPWRKLSGHHGKVETLQFSITGKQLVTGGNDKLVNVWDIDSGKIIHTLEGHQQRVTQARFVHDDTIIVSTSMDGTTRLWDAKTGDLLQTLSNHDGAIYDIAVNSNGKLWSTISYDGSALIMDADSRKVIHKLEGQNEPLYTVSFSPDSKRIATAGDTTAALWNAETGELVKMLDTGIAAIREIRFSSDSQQMVIRGEDNHVDVHNAVSGELSYILNGHEDSAIWSAVFSPDDQQLLTAGGDGTVRLWESASGTPEKTLIGHDVSVSTARFNANGSSIASAGADGAAILWQPENARIVAKLEGHQSAVSSLVFHPQEQWLATAGDDGTAAIWRIGDLTDSKQFDGHTLVGHGGGGQAIAFDPVNPRAATGAYEGTVFLWNTQDGSSLGQLSADDKGVYSIDYRPDGKQLAIVGGSSNLKLWDVDSKTLVSDTQVSSAANLWVQYNHAGNVIAVSSVDGSANLVDANSGESLHKLEGHEGALFWADFSPDDKLLATASYADNTVRIWDTETGNTIHVLAGHSGGIYRCSFSADGERLVTASNDTSAKVWSMKTGSVLFELNDHTSTVRAAAFSPDDSVIVTASYDNTAKIWSAEDGSLLHTLTGHQANLMTIAFAPDSSWFLTTSYDSTTRIWDTKSGETLHTLTGHTDKLEYAAINADGSKLITQGHDDRPRLWSSNISDLINQAAQKLPRAQPYFSTAELRRFRLGDRLNKRELAETALAALPVEANAESADTAFNIISEATAIDASFIQAPKYQRYVVKLKSTLEGQLTSTDNTAASIDKTRSMLEMLAALVPAAE